MSFPRVARAGVLRHLRLGDALSHQTRVIGLQHQLRRLSLIAPSRCTTPLAGSLPVLRSLPSRSFATATGESTEANSDKPKRGTKSKPKKKKKTAKAAPKKPKKRGLTEKQKEAKAKKQRKELIEQLKAAALEPPQKLSTATRAMFIKEKLAELKSQPQSANQSPQELFKEAGRQVTDEWSAESERFLNQARENRAANETAFAEWVQQYTPRQIKDANTARQTLRRLIGKDKIKHKFRPIKDDRLVKPPQSAYLWFFQERFASGDFQYISKLSDASAPIGAEWKNMSEHQQAPYVEKFNQDHARWVSEYRQVYGEEPAPPQKKKSTSSP
ncbi:hypothetical protein N7462_000504 [Penicillium macrosclerotiorum]|uniref:uncharacterized protein n=1 Tax=Penicillium macrosclerotiorum TaxID=303699 RepID=UPI002547E0BE|nr:uncharacterized protein N7462_000504 [Penicillium macrosclerotiorum]KAJ5698499.1 hypothetical protein N7462_000504 [Penicillium macrosclerotiorum]